jgi:hypothetical protein
MTPFGSEGGEGALEDGFRWFLARSEPEAAATEGRRGIRWIVLSDPIPEVALGTVVVGSSAAVPPARLVRDVREGVGIELGAAIEEVVSVRLFYSDGTRLQGADALSRYRLVDEVADGGGKPLVKLFEVVPGARVEVTGAAPGALVVVALAARVNGARPFRYETAATAGQAGTVELVVPYATGRSGALDVRAARVVSGGAEAILAIPEGAVAAGAKVRVALRPVP